MPQRRKIGSTRRISVGREAGIAVSRATLRPPSRLHTFRNSPSRMTRMTPRWDAPDWIECTATINSLINLIEIGVALPFSGCHTCLPTALSPTSGAVAPNGMPKTDPSLLKSFTIRIGNRELS